MESIGGQARRAAPGTNWTIDLIEWARKCSLSKWLANAAGYEEAPVPPDWIVAAVGAGIAVGLVLAFISVVAMFSIWLERRVAGRIQSRIGPNRVGPFGLLQSLADGVKLLLKEDIIPSGADRSLFILAPALVMASALGMFAALPMAAGAGFTDLNLGIIFIIAVSSLATIGVIMAGWSSNNKWALYGAMREAAQVVSYEIPLGLSLLVPAVVAGSMNLREITESQSSWSGACWLIFQNPICLPAFVLYFVAALAETKRAPFDLPESESELVAGFHVEYSGIRFSFFFLEEYGAMFIMSALGVALFLGGWNFPGIDVLHGGWLVATQLLVFVIKSLCMILLMIWVRWTLPRLRVDQVMVMSYKYLTPIGLGLVVASAGWEVLVAGGLPFNDRPFWMQAATPALVVFVCLLLGWMLRKQSVDSAAAPFAARSSAPGAIQT
ncbi:MAG: NADH-quinone oxidoreductase subunit NuoH [Planctomycetes bacterium]|nr:NADH-quinone oxidoreductase subunit NuoH [Planctomycetota bacterium]